MEAKYQVFIEGKGECVLAGKADIKNYAPASANFHCRRNAERCAERIARDVRYQLDVVVENPGYGGEILRGPKD